MKKINMPNRPKNNDDIAVVRHSLPSDVEIRVFARAYAKLWDDEVYKSIAKTAYHKGCKRIIKIIEGNEA